MVAVSTEIPSAWYSTSWHSSFSLSGPERFRSATSATSLYHPTIPAEKRRGDLGRVGTGGADRQIQARPIYRLRMSSIKDT